MLKFVIPALVAAGWIAAVALPTGASAAPAGLAAVAAPDTAVQESRYMGRRYMGGRRMMRRSGYRAMYRGRGMGRMAAPSQAGNARNPSAPVGQQQQGQTTGGPRY